MSAAARDAAIAEDRSWAYRTFSGGRQTVTARYIAFGPAHVVWRDGEGRIVLAEANSNVHELTEVGHAGAATRGAVVPRG